MILKFLWTSKRPRIENNIKEEQSQTPDTNQL